LRKVEVGPENELERSGRTYGTEGYPVINKTSKEPREKETGCKALTRKFKQNWEESRSSHER
jgi:hypothetical protein